MVHLFYLKCVGDSWKSFYMIKFCINVKFLSFNKKKWKKETFNIRFYNCNKTEVHFKAFYTSLPGLIVIVPPRKSRVSNIYHLAASVQFYLFQEHSRLKKKHQRYWYFCTEVEKNRRHTKKNYTGILPSLCRIFFIGTCK